MTPYTSIAIRIVRFPLAVLVVFIHSVGPTDNIAYYPFRDFFSHTFCSFVVPAFFIISGFLFFQRMENGFTKKIYIKKLNSRISTLLIPYFVWNAVTLVIDLLKFYIGRPSWIDYGNASIGEIIVHCFWGNVSDISSGIYYPINLPLWYIRDLIVLCLFSPIIYKICDKFGWFTIVALTVSYFLGLHLLYFNLLGILFFSLGAFLAIHNRNLVYDQVVLYVSHYHYRTDCLYNDRTRNNPKIIYFYYAILYIFSMFENKKSRKNSLFGQVFNSDIL